VQQMVVNLQLSKYEQAFVGRDCSNYLKNIRKFSLLHLYQRKLVNTIGATYTGTSGFQLAKKFR
jgi:hypothetical protein